MEFKAVYILSDEENEILENGAVRFKCSKKDLLSMLIRELSPSTNDDRDFLREIYRKERAEVLTKKSSGVEKKLWRHGYLAGWKHFQIRKKDSLFFKYNNRPDERDDL